MEPFVPAFCFPWSKFYLIAFLFFFNLFNDMQFRLYHRENAHSGHHHRYKHKKTYRSCNYHVKDWPSSVHALIQIENDLLHDQKTHWRSYKARRVSVSAVKSFKLLLLVRMLWLELHQDRFHCLMIQNILCSVEVLLGQIGSGIYVLLIFSIRQYSLLIVVIIRGHPHQINWRTIEGCDARDRFLFRSTDLRNTYDKYDGADRFTNLESASPAQLDLASVRSISYTPAWYFKTMWLDYNFYHLLLFY